MMRLFFILLCSLAEASYSKPGGVDIQPRIVGGNVADPTRYPYFVYVDITDSDGDSFTCGGTLIHPDIVLTAAHCHTGSDSIVAIVGASSLTDTTGSYSRSVDRYIPHPNYDEETADNDVLLLKLTTPVFEITPVNFRPPEGVPVDHQEVWGFGFGTLGTDDETEVTELRDVALGIEWIEQCKYQYRFDEIPVFEDIHICASAPGKDTCFGDSGGPLVVRGQDSMGDIQVGIVSFGLGCAVESHAGVYARVSNYVDWIDEQICSFSAVPGRLCGPTASPYPTASSVPSTAPTSSPRPSGSTMPSSAPTVTDPISGAMTYFEVSMIGVFAMTTLVACQMM